MGRYGQWKVQLQEEREREWEREGESEIREREGRKENVTICIHVMIIIGWYRFIMTTEYHKLPLHLLTCSVCQCTFSLSQVASSPHLVPWLLP